jgi:chitin disaccharide deacetylase
VNEKRLIVNADDFGMSRGISDGILLAHQYGFLTSASLMVNMPAAEYAIARLHTAPALEVGIHLNICQGKPLSSPRDIPSLLDASGHFHTPPVMIRKLWKWQVVSRELEREFRLQIRWMKDRGVRPLHADSHHHMHIYPGAVAAFARALAAEEIQSVRASRCTCWPKNGPMGGPHEGGILRRLLVHAYRSTLQSAILHKFNSADSRVCFLSLDRRKSDSLGERWKAAFESLPPGTFEFACHPGLFERGFSESDPIHRQRENELCWLTDPKMRQAIDRNRIQLITYADLREVRRPHHAAAEVAA